MSFFRLDTHERNSSVGDPSKQFSETRNLLEGGL